jgi:hypothetical protein
VKNNIYQRTHFGVKQLGVAFLDLKKEMASPGIERDSSLKAEFLSISGFKTSDQVQGQGVRPIGKAQSA